MPNASNQPTGPGNGKHKGQTMSQDTAGKVSNEFQNFLSDIEEMVKATTTLTGEELAKANADIKERISSAKASIEGASDTIAKRAKKTAELTNNYVHDQPWLVIGASSAIGFLLGFMLARRP